MAANSPLLRPQPRVSCVGKRGDRPADARVEALNLKELCPCGGRVNRRGALRAAVQGVLAGFLRVAPTSHARQCTAPPRLMPAPRAPAASRGKGKCWPSRPRWTCTHPHRGGAARGRGGHFEAIFRGWLPGIGVHILICAEIVITFLTVRLSNLYGKSVTKNSLRSQPEPGPRPD